MADLATQAGAIGPLQEELRQVKEAFGRFQDQQVQLRTQLEETIRQQMSEAERGRVQVGDLHRRLEDLERKGEGWLDRQSGVEDAARRYQEGIALANVRAEGMEQRLEALEGRASRNLEATNRIERNPPHRCRNPGP